MKKIFILGITFASVLMNAQVTIAQVYGGGGNSGSVYNRDFVVLFNKTSSAIDISGWSLQYDTASSIGNWKVKTLPAGAIIQGYSYFLIGLASQEVSEGAPLPLTVDYDAGMSIMNNITVTDGKIALMNNSTVINGIAPVGAIDFVGFGAANAYEGGSAAPEASATNAIFRLNGGCTDTDDNSNDFVTGTPSPLNSTSAVNDCSSLLGVADIKNLKPGNFVKNSFVRNNEIIFGADVKDIKVFNMLGQIVKTASVKQNGIVSVSELEKGNYIVTGTVNNEPTYQKILKE